MSAKTENNTEIADTIETVKFPEGPMISGPTNTLKIGEFNATVLEAYPSATQTGTPCIKLRLDLGYTKQNHLLFWTENAQERSQKQLTRSFGAPELDGDNILEELAKIIGKPCSVNVQEREKPDGTTRVEIAWVNPVKTIITDKAQLHSMFAKRAPKEEVAFE
jgi:hypothetical protein